MKGLTPNPIFLQSRRQLLWPSVNKKHVCVSLIITMMCPPHVAKFSLCESHHHQVSNFMLHITSFRAQNMWKPEGARFGL